MGTDGGGAMIEVRGLSARYPASANRRPGRSRGGYPAAGIAAAEPFGLRDITARFPAGITAVLGPSGSGKSTLLRVIAGLHPADAGTVAIDGEDRTAYPAHRRGGGLLFQDGQLFTHLDVHANVGYGLRRLPRAARADRIAQCLALVGLAGLGRRRVEELSGGQAQRVALARTLAPNPRFLLLDEPFAALDTELKRRLGAEVKALMHDAQIPGIMVTHDYAEAARLASRILILSDGRVIQQGETEAVWRAPATPVAARLLGYDTLLDAAGVTIQEPTEPGGGPTVAAAARTPDLPFDVPATVPVGPA